MLHHYCLNSTWQIVECIIWNCNAWWVVVKIMQNYCLSIFSAKKLPLLIAFSNALFIRFVLRLSMIPSLFLHGHGSSPVPSRLCWPFTFMAAQIQIHLPISYLAIHKSFWISRTFNINWAPISRFATEVPHTVGPLSECNSNINDSLLLAWMYTIISAPLLNIHS